jgi:Leucine rich repeat
MAKNKIPHFLKEAEAAGELEMIDSLRELLHNAQSENVLIAAEMLKSGGVPTVLQEEILLLSKISEESIVRSTLRRVLEQCELIPLALSQNALSFTKIAHRREPEVYEQMMKMMQTIPWEALVYFSFLLFKHYKKGLSILLKQHKKHPDRLKALELLTQDGFFDFSKGVGYHDWRNAPLESVISFGKMNSGVAFPDDHPAPLTVRHLSLHNCKLSKLPDDIAIFQQVESIDLSVNYITKLPKIFVELKALKQLNLAMNNIRFFPMLLSKMKQLNRLDLTYCFRSTGSNIEVPASFLEALPDCKIIFKH